MEKREWKLFKVNDLFNVEASTSTPISKLNNTGEYPYITTKAINNGVGGYFDKYTDKGNVLCVDSAVAGFMTYQDKNFTASDHVEKLIPKFNLNKNIAYFICSIWNRFYAHKKYSYVVKASKEHIRKDLLYLPIDNNGNPDWEYMNNTIQQLEKRLLERLILAKKDGTIPNLKSINSSKWKKFKISDIFKQERGKEKAPNQSKLGSVICINELNTNNGYTKLISPVKIFPKNSITISINYAQNVFFQPKEFGASVNIVILENPNLNKFNGIFVVTVLKKYFKKYDYLNKISKEKINDTVICLPADKNGNPDWKYMEDYIKDSIGQ